MHSNQTVGKYGEQLAIRHLQRRGYEILETNWRTAAGELDIIARAGDLVVIVEVKTRRGLSFGYPASAVTSAKLRRMKKLATQWLREQSEFYPDVRFDVISVLCTDCGKVQVDHLQAVI